MSSIRTEKGIIKLNNSLTARNDAKTKIQMQVRFGLSKDFSVIQIVRNYTKTGEIDEFQRFLLQLQNIDLQDDDLLKLLRETRECVQLLKPTVKDLIFRILDYKCLQSSNENIVNEYQLFLVDLLTAHNKYAGIVIDSLISFWVLKDDDASNWVDDNPSESLLKILKNTHVLLSKLVDIIPMTFDIILEKIKFKFPFYMKPPHVISCYVHNILCLVEYNKFEFELFQIIFERLVVIDSNVPRNAIEDSEFEFENGESDIQDPDTITQTTLMKQNYKMKLELAETLDICLNKLIEFIYHKFKTIKECDDQIGSQLEHQLYVDKIFNMFLILFEKIVLISHNPHHIQFLLFYFCSLKLRYTEAFVKILWRKVYDPNMVPAIRQISISYISSFLARAKLVPLRLIKTMLKEISTWAHQYIERSDSMKFNHSVKGHPVFYSVCQSIFYIIAFRSRQLTEGSTNLIFLQSLHLSSLVTCHLNPLRVCLPSIVNAFSRITKVHQLAYCHAIIEKNDRKKIATVYTNTEENVDEMLETFFPFDPCLLKRTGEKITPIFLQYQNCKTDNVEYQTSIKRQRRDSTASGDSNEGEEDDYDFLMLSKKQKICEFTKSFDSKFSYLTHPGFFK